MDLGIFRRSRAIFSLWIGLPLVTLIAVETGSAGYCYWARKRLSESRDRLRAIVELSACREDVSKALERVLRNDADLPDSTEAISSWLDELAPISKFTVETLSVSKSDGSVQGRRSSISRKKKASDPPDEGHTGVPYLSVTLKGRGSYLSLVKFLRLLESEHLLVTVSGLRVRTAGHEKAGDYMCDLTFNIYLVEG